MPGRPTSSVLDRADAAPGSPTNRMMHIEATHISAGSDCDPQGLLGLWCRGHFPWETDVRSFVKYAHCAYNQDDLIEQSSEHDFRRFTVA
jgi:hypothetical protein